MERDHIADGADSTGNKPTSRRDILKLSGIGIAGASLPIAVVGQSKASSTNTIDVSDENSVREYAKKILTSDSKQESEKLWEQLDADQASVVDEYMDKHSSTEIGPIETNTDYDTVETESGSVPTKPMEPSGSSDEVTASGFVARYNVPVKRKTMGIKVYQMNHVMGWGKNSNKCCFTRDNSYGNGSRTYWDDLRESYSVHNEYTNNVNSYKTREYRHNPPMICNKYFAKIDLRGYRNGRLEAIRKNPNFNKHGC